MDIADQYLQAFMPHSKVEALTDAASVAAVASPVWLPYLKEVSEITAIMLPIGGLIWIIVQIVAKIMVTRKILRDEQESEDER